MIQQGGKLDGTGGTGTGRFGYSRRALRRRRYRAGRRALREHRRRRRPGSSSARAPPGPSRAESWSAPAIPEPANSATSEKANSASSVALSADGDTALIGAPGRRRRQRRGLGLHPLGSTWTQQGEKLTGAGEAGGSGSAKGRALRRRQHRADRRPATTNSNTGAAWVFTRTGSTWTQQGGKLTGDGETGAGRFGAGVALSEHGDTALIGGPGDEQRHGRGLGVHAHRLDLEPSRAKSSPAAGRGRSRRIRHERRALRRRRHGADRWARRQRQRRRRLGLHPLGHDLGPAGRKAHRRRRRAETAGSARASRSPPTATRRWSAGRATERRHRRRLGLHPLGRPPGPSRAKS